MHKPLLLVAFLGLAACTQQSQEEYATVAGSRLAISAEMTPGVIDAKFVLRINGAPVINDRTEPFGGTSQNFSGSYDGRPVSARVTAVSKMFSAYTMVDVFIDGQLVETLTI
ncbi:hypothetical protein GE300_08895 [Rhodobacteraceae bacterium 2CG4]|uniref:Lipoprotein n=1 Tax=Halovulum marinum TaxID=2662447 RepID=A0A6L5Z174_9RHOB|nr:hypothetical protein [Halovulum marinum]MSU89734.1 hypothetical protein [Halovulum marinum]